MLAVLLGVFVVVAGTIVKNKIQRLRAAQVDWTPLNDMANHGL